MRTLEEIQKRFTDEVQYIDDTAQILLKGHLVMEDLMSQSIEAFVLHGEYVEDARLQFHQKLAICRSISVEEDKNNMWNLIRQINNLRNTLSHSLDPARREKAVQSLKSIYDQEFEPKSRQIDGASEEAALCLVAVSGALGFLHGFHTEMKKLESLIKTLNFAMKYGHGK